MLETKLQEFNREDKVSLATLEQKFIKKETDRLKGMLQ